MTSPLQPPDGLCCRPILDEVRVYGLDQVAEVTRMALWSLERDVRAGRLEHVARGRMRGMTVEQIRKLVDAHTRCAEEESPIRSGAGRASRRR